MNSKLLTQSAILLLIIVQCVCASWSCAGPTPPPDEKGRGPRSYTWSRDTVGSGAFQVIPSGVWSSAWNNVFVVGHSSDMFREKLWRFDGSRWMDQPELFTGPYYQNHSGPLPFFTPTNVYGLGDECVWIVGSMDTTDIPGAADGGFALQFDGSNWHGHFLPIFPPLVGLWASSPNDVWVAGANGRVFSYNGQMWSSSSVPESLGITRISGRSANDVYFMGADYGGISTEYSIYHWNGTSIDLLESTIDGVGQTGFTDRVFVSTETLYSVVSQRILKRMSVANWQPVFESSQLDFWNIAGSSSSNILAVGGSNGESVVHFNGEDWVQLRQFSASNTRLAHAWIGSDHINIVGTSSPSLRFVVLRGK